MSKSPGHRADEIGEPTDAPESASRAFLQWKISRADRVIRTVRLPMFGGGRTNGLGTWLLAVEAPTVGSAARIMTSVSLREEISCGRERLPERTILLGG